MRERQNEFETPSVELVGASTSRRPDAVSLDVRFAPGPIGLTDPSQGLLIRSWKARVDNETGQVFIARANDENDGWDDETLFFEFDWDIDAPGLHDTGGIIVEMAFAFNQNGDPNFVCQREDGNIWIRYFQAGVGFIFEMKGPGRTPVAILDDPTRPQESELLAWYIEGGTLRYRSQLSNYNDEIDMGVAMDATHHLEGAIRAQTKRLELVYSIRNEVTGQWELRWITSQMYPHDFIDPLSLAHSTTAGLLRIIIIDKSLAIDPMAMNHRIVAALLESVTYDIAAGDSMAYTPEILDLTLVELLIPHTADIEQFDINHRIEDGVLVVIVIVHGADVEQMDLNHRITAAVLA